MAMQSVETSKIAREVQDNQPVVLGILCVSVGASEEPVQDVRRILRMAALGPTVPVYLHSTGMSMNAAVSPREKLPCRPSLPQGDQGRRGQVSSWRLSGRTARCVIGNGYAVRGGDASLVPGCCIGREKRRRVIGLSWAGDSPMRSCVSVSVDGQRGRESETGAEKLRWTEMDRQQEATGLAR